MENVLRYLLSSNHYHGTPWKSNSNRSAKTWKQLSMFEERNFHFMFALQFWCRKEAAQLSLSAFGGLEVHRPNLSSVRPSVTTGSFCFLSVFLPGTWRLLNSKQKQAVYISCEVPQATTECWDRGPGGDALCFRFACIQKSSTEQWHLSWCWRSSSTKNKITNKFVVDRLAQAKCSSVRAEHL